MEMQQTCIGKLNTEVICFDCFFAIELNFIPLECSLHQQLNIFCIVVLVYMFVYVACFSIYSICQRMYMGKHKRLRFLKQYKNVPRVFSPFLITDANVTLMKSAQFRVYSSAYTERLGLDTSHIFQVESHFPSGHSTPSYFKIFLTFCATGGKKVWFSLLWIAKPQAVGCPTSSVNFCKLH